MAANKLPKKPEHLGVPYFDRISFLPRTVLLHILSFLPTETAVRTCILSTRWRYLWTSVPSLDFDSYRFPSRPRPMPEGTSVNTVRKTKFKDFVDKVLMLHDDSDLYKLCLYYDSLKDVSPVYTWIRSAIRRNVRELDITISFLGDFEFPHCVFTSQSLEVLMLCFGCKLLKWHTDIGLGNLKNLSLVQCKALAHVSNSEPFQTLELLNCPQLEYLQIHVCTLKEINIFAPKLEILIIKDDWLEVKKFKLSAPNLLSFKYEGVIADEFDVGNLSSLAHGDFHVGGWSDENAGMCMGKLIQEVFKAEALTLSRSCIRLLSKAPNVLEFLPTPNDNLKSLKLTALLGEFDHVQVIACLLKRYISLETLAIDIGEPFDHAPNMFYCRDLSFECPLDHLKEVEIRHFGGGEDELQFVKFLLERAKVLERMVIFTSKTGWTDLKKRMGFSKLMALPRASSCIAIGLMDYHRSYK